MNSTQVIFKFWKNLGKIRKQFTHQMNMRILLKHQPKKIGTVIPVARHEIKKFWDGGTKLFKER